LKCALNAINLNLTLTPQVGHEITELEFKLFCYSLCEVYKRGKWEDVILTKFAEK
jgi:hypothetical protein